jgi:hypothetical protein
MSIGLIKPVRVVVHKGPVMDILNNTASNRGSRSVSPTTTAIIRGPSGANT